MKADNTCFFTFVSFISLKISWKDFWLKCSTDKSCRKSLELSLAAQYLRSCLLQTNISITTPHNIIPLFICCRYLSGIFEFVVFQNLYISTKSFLHLHFCNCCCSFTAFADLHLLEILENIKYIFLFKHPYKCFLVFFFVIYKQWLTFHCTWQSNTKQYKKHAQCNAMITFS